MDFRQARIGMDIMEKYQSTQLRDWGDEANRKLPIDGTLEFEHDVCYITLPRASDNPELTDIERQTMEDAGWFFDEKVQSWSHF